MDINIFIRLLIIFILITSLFYGQGFFKTIFGRNCRNASLNKEYTDLLKTIAIIGIFISHIVTHSNFAVNHSYAPIIQKALLYFLSHLGSNGVCIFFLLSGYGNYISITSNNNEKIKNWIFRRLHQFVWVSSSLGYTPYPCSA